MPRKKQALNFEQSLQALEKLVEQLESGELSLEESLQTFEQGIKLTRQCQEALKEAEQKVQLLVEKNNSLSTQPFAEEDDAQ
ncbi:MULTISPECIES: exodeoxyribonuclease VII small subunit [Zooshikella]|uniref:Exodeoxyribonuclease 7 small subunit n=1 Tax=Zooshikella harenae TaxID=2827238 RepID=A0ABS5ZI45_9GAMM|nr:exodeoxyribonuclease VII small subunit [Zooshikella harenae]MBU2712677.1 exodeoxyribonuclease VII small subunit [Zooshikella harenae]